MIVLGLNAYHGDAAACVMKDGVLIAAAEEERFRRIKHCSGFPADAIRYCLEEAGATIREIDHVAVNSNPKANLWRRAAYTMSQRPEIGLIVDRLRNQHRRASIETDFQSAFPGKRLRARTHYIEHHLAHLASAYFASPFDDAVIVSIDGFGDFASTAWGIARGGEMSVDGRVFFPHSLGIFYQALTQFLGFHNYGDEYKVMGLAPYGQPTFRDEMQKILRVAHDGAFSLDLRCFRHHHEKIEHHWKDGAPQIGVLYSEALIELLGPPREKTEPIDDRVRNIARSTQEAFEFAVYRLLSHFHSRYGVDNLAIAGGCAMNSAANGKIAQRTPFRRVFVPAAAGDAGGAIGAAMLVSRKLDAGVGRCGHRGAYLGPCASAEAIATAVAFRETEIAVAGCQIKNGLSEEDRCVLAAQEIAKGKVVGWFQGRMEWGPRALGNRSILADPRRADMRDVLNAKITRRELFRPFAPSILAGHAAEYFEDAPDAPYMTHVVRIREEKRAMIPAVTHIDGTGRPQMVTREANPLFYQLITAFYAISGVPVLLNTSFNESEPIVCRPEEAIDCFLRTEMDALFLGDVTLTRFGLSH